MLIDRNSRANYLKRRNTEWTVAFLMIAPTIISFIIFLYIPFVQALQTSFYKYNGLGTLENFLGIKNYIKVFNDSKFFHSLYNTVLLMGSGILAVPIGFILAYVLFLEVPGYKIFNTMLFIPYLISMVVVGSIWRIIYDPAIGPLNQILDAIGLHNITRAWLSRPESALGSIAVTWVWRSAPFNMLIIYANIGKMPNDFIEAADLDGANSLQKLMYVIIPYLKPTFSTLFLLSVTNALRLFDLIWVMTKGGPGGASDVVTSYIYTKAFTNMDFGLGTAASVVLMVIMVSIMALFSLGKKYVSTKGNV